MIEPTHSDPSMSHQCRLLGLPRSSYYHRLKPESAENLALMKAIDKAHTDQPYFGARQLVRFLGNQGWVVNRKREDPNGVRTWGGGVDWKAGW